MEFPLYVIQASVLSLIPPKEHAVLLQITICTHHSHVHQTASAVDQTVQMIMMADVSVVSIWKVLRSVTCSLETKSDKDISMTYFPSCIQVLKISVIPNGDSMKSA